jgi:hypothetical protein
MLLKERRAIIKRRNFSGIHGAAKRVDAGPGGANRYAFVGNSPIGFTTTLDSRRCSVLHWNPCLHKFDAGATFGFGREIHRAKHVLWKGVLKSPDPDDGPGSNCVEYTVKKEKQDAYYDCVRKTAEDDYKNQGMWYSVFGRNCQTWLISVFKKCNSEVLMTP